jgi:hypothetical protein
LSVNKGDSPLSVDIIREPFSITFSIIRLYLDCASKLEAYGYPYNRLPLALL